MDAWALVAVYAFQVAALVGLGDLDLLILGGAAILVGTAYGFAKTGGDTTLTITSPYTEPEQVNLSKAA